MVRNSCNIVVTTTKPILSTFFKCFDPILSGAKLVGRSGQNVFISQHGHFQVKTADKKIN